MITVVLSAMFGPQMVSQYCQSDEFFVTYWSWKIKYFPVQMLVCAEVMLVEKPFITKGTFILECARMKCHPVRVHRSLILELFATIHTGHRLSSCRWILFVTSVEHIHQVLINLHFRLWEMTRNSSGIDRCTFVGYGLASGNSESCVNALDTMPWPPPLPPLQYSCSAHQQFWLSHFQICQLWFDLWEHEFSLTPCNSSTWPQSVSPLQPYFCSELKWSKNKHVQICKQAVGISVQLNGQQYCIAFQEIWPQSC